MKALLIVWLTLGMVSFAHANFDDETPEFNAESANDVLQGMPASDEFLEAKERIQAEQDRPDLSDEEAAMLLLTNNSQQ